MRGLNKSSLRLVLVEISEDFPIHIIKSKRRISSCVPCNCVIVISNCVPECGFELVLLLYLIRTGVALDVFEMGRSIYDPIPTLLMDETDLVGMFCKSYPTVPPLFLFRSFEKKFLPVLSLRTRLWGGR